jgi:CMP-N-acetylneuraminic acid synthetase
MTDPHLEPRFLALVPARGASKGIPGKNIKQMAGKPLIAWTLLAAKASKYPLRVVCSTDDEEIAKIARAWGAETPFLRPDHLATDDAPTPGVVLHALEALAESFTHVVLLQPTSPMRTSSDIDGAIEVALSRSANAVVSVAPAQTHPYLTYTMDSSGELSTFCRPEGVSLRRQDLPSAFELNGAVYVSRVSSLRETESFIPDGCLAFPMPAERSVDIDNSDDWERAERMLRAHG